VCNSGQWPAKFARSSSGTPISVVVAPLGFEANTSATSRYNNTSIPPRHPESDPSGSDRAED
jgi:hypothetical protein